MAAASKPPRAATSAEDAGALDDQLASIRATIDHLRSVLARSARHLAGIEQQSRAARDALQTATPRPVTGVHRVEQMTPSNDSDVDDE